MSLINSFLSKSIKFPDTKYNKNIQIILGLGEPTLVADNLIESGHLLTDIWKTGIKKLLPEHFQPQTILLLGLGGGSNAILVSKLFPKAQITAIEIDSQMAEIAIKYFKVNKIKNLKVVIADAEEYICNLQPKADPPMAEKSEICDLILVDCFIGKNIPQPLQKMSFIKELYRRSRFTLINRIWYNEHHLETVFFLRDLSKHFFYLKTHTKTNIIVSLV